MVSGSFKRVEESKSTARLIVNDQEVRFTIDTGAEVNTICQKFVRRDQVQPVTQRLIMWNGAKMIPRGEVTLPVYNEKSKSTHDISFTVVKNAFSCLLGLETVKSLGFVTINEDKFVTKVDADSCDLGDLGEASLKSDPAKKPRQLPCRKVPFAIQDKVYNEIQKLVQRGVVTPVSQPTKWVIQMAFAEKTNGDIRICIDPHDVLMREHF